MTNRDSEKLINRFLRFCIRKKIHFCVLNLKNKFEGDFECINEFKLADEFMEEINSNAS